MSSTRRPKGELLICMNHGERRDPTMSSTSRPRGELLVCMNHEAETLFLEQNA
ncbi:hypothetical protein [Enterococcus moraviensis]|nr:hypothetical protein [Enterococcus moraviensis]